MAERVGGDARGGTTGHQHDIPPSAHAGISSQVPDLAQIQATTLRTAKEEGERGLKLFLEERYDQARKCFEAACILDPADARWVDLRERSASNHTARYHCGLRAKPLSAATLLAPPALALREPVGVEPMPPGPAVSRRMLAGVMKVAGLVLGFVLGIGVRIIGGKGQAQTWVSWPKRRSFFLRDLGLAAIRHYMNHHTLQDPYPGNLIGGQCPGQRRPEWTERYRTATGAWNTDNPMEGAAGTPFLWQGNELLRSGDTAEMDPNPIKVANLLLRCTGERETVPFLNLLAVGWIQFMVHDWFNHRQTDNGTISVEIPPEDARRAKYGQQCMKFRRTEPPVVGEDQFAFVNEVSAWWDGSQIYGSDQMTQDRLRARDRSTWLSRLEVDHAEREQRPHNQPAFDPSAMLQPQGKLFVEHGMLPLDDTTSVVDSGFTRNMWVGIELFHTLFVRHHNWLCDEYANEHPSWSSDQIFNHARLENAATMAKIHTIEWTPAVLPTKELAFGMNANWHGFVETFLRSFEDRKPLRAFQPIHPLLGGIVGGELNNFGVPQNFSEQFAEVYRLHAGLPDTIDVRPLDGTPTSAIPTERTRAAGSRNTIMQFDIQTLVNSFGHQHMPALVNNNYPTFMTEMSTEGAPLFDMAAADIVRARERGVPRFNEFRRQIGMPEVTSFSELTDDTTITGKLEHLYGSGKPGVDKMDLVVGMLCDRNRPLKGFDNTRFAIFLLAATRRLQTDPFFTEKYNERYYTKAGLERIDRMTLKELLLMHFPDLTKSGLIGVNNAFEPWGTTAATAPHEHPLATLERYRTPA